MASLNVICRRICNEIDTAIQNNDFELAKEKFDSSIKGKTIEKDVLDELRKKHDVSFLLQDEPKKEVAVIDKNIDKKEPVTKVRADESADTDILLPAATPSEKTRASFNMTQLSLIRFNAIRAVLDNEDLNGDSGNYPRRGGSDKLFTELLNNIYQQFNPSQKELFNKIIELEMLKTKKRK
ncbi:hypothetical protein [Streptococcus salivarius]|uniref:hypothetical protein n=1 Tax=Streptococcus salivarius TaxID=1304 RepID=UPI00189B3677|nr:hypothetical protein [Streptococcus salivarius]MDU6722956.1 hypothetical protein [Streptococcus mitis]